MIHSILFFYGSEIDKIEYEKLIKNYGEINLYSLVYKQGLQIRDVGEIGSSWNYIIGKEIYIDNNNIINFVIKKDGIYIGKEQVKLKIDENEIRKKLLDININIQPEYKMFCSWQN